MIPRTRRYPMRPIRRADPRAQAQRGQVKALDALAAGRYAVQRAAWVTAPVLTQHPDLAMRGTFRGLAFMTDVELDEWFARCGRTLRALRGGE